MNINNSPNYMGLPFDPYNGAGAPQMGFQQSQNPYGFTQNAPKMIQNNVPQRPNIDPRIFDTPDITLGSKPLFSVASENTIPIDNSSDADNRKRKTGNPNKRAKKAEDTSLIVRADGSPEPVKGEIEPAATIYSYQETNNMLHETLGQIDAINLELVQEFNNVRHSRTMKNKYNVLNALSENIGSMISNRLTTIKEINNCISKSNEMDYKKYKDVQAAQSAMNDDKYIADVYQALMANPQAQPTQLQMPQVDSSILGSGIVRANVTQGDIGGSNPIDVGYLNYMANLTPEQNLMRYEGNPNVKQVVVYDAATGNKFFQMMDMSTGEAITNVPTYDNTIMEDTTLDLKTKIAKNININQTFPIIVLNDNITSQY